MPQSRPTDVSKSAVDIALETEKVPRLGLIVLSTDLTSEGDVYGAFAGEGVAIHTTRIAYANPTTYDNLMKTLPELGKAAELFPDGVELAAITYSCTSASVALGEDRVAEAIQQGAYANTPVITPIGAVIDACRHVSAHRLAVLTPYVENTASNMSDYLREKGFDIVDCHYLDMEDDREMARITTATLVDAVSALDLQTADAIFISCTAMPVLSHIEDLEAKFGLPVISSNLASIWAMSRYVGVPPKRLRGLRLFQ